MDNFSIGFHKFSVTEIYNLLSNENLHAQIAKIFFNGKIPYTEILEYVKIQRKVPQKRNINIYVGGNNKWKIIMKFIKAML